MEGSMDANAAQLHSFIQAAEQSTLHDDQRTATACNAPGPISNLEIRNRLPATVGDIMEDRQGEAEDTSMVPHTDNTLELSAGVQHSDVNLVSRKTESKSNTQQLNDGDKSPIQCSSNMGGNTKDDDDAMDNRLPSATTADVGDDMLSDPHRLNMPLDQAYDDARDDGRGSFADSGGDTDVHDDEESSVNQIEQHSCIGCSHARFHDWPQTRQIMAQHASIPGPQSFTSLGDLLSSHNAPGRGLYKIEKVLEENKRKAADLEEDIRCLQAQHDACSELRDEADVMVRQARMTFSHNLGAIGISNELWAEYEAFCMSLEPKSGSDKGWSVTCFGNHNGSYVQWDPNLDLFKDSAEISLGNRNFRCEAFATNDKGETEYVVEFWPLDRLEPRTGTARTWKQQYPKLYGLAEGAANNSPGANTVAQQLLWSLPDPNLSFMGRWLFDYALEPARAQHPTKARRWSYRSACRIPVDGRQDSNQDPDQYDPTTTSESESSTSQDDEMGCDESEPCESQDVNMEGDVSESVGSWHPDSETEDDVFRCT